MGRTGDLIQAGTPALDAGPQAHDRQRSQILHGVASIGLARVAAIVIDGLCYILVARYLGPADYGHYLALMAFLTLIDLTGDMTLFDVTVREISNDPGRTRVWVFAGTLLRTALSAAGFAAYAAYVLLGPGDRTPALLPAAWIAALILPAGVLRMPLAAFRARMKMHYELVIIVITRLVNLLLFVACINGQAGLAPLFLAVVASRLLLAVLAWPVLMRLPGSPQWFDAAAVRRLFRESLPMAVSGAFVAAQLKVDILMIAAIVGASTAGLYGVVAQLPEYLLSVPVIISTPMLPVLSRVFSAHDTARFSELYQKLFDAVLIVVTPMAVLAALVPEPILVLLFGERFVQASSVMPLLMLTIAAMWASHAIAITAVAARLQRTFVPIQAGCVAVYLALNWLLIPRLGMTGAAVTRLAATVLAAAATYQLLKRRTGSTLDPWRFARIAGAGLVMAIGVTAAARLSLPLVVAVGAAVYAGALWALSAGPHAPVLARERT
jgi:PST family polysaccharide transporter